MGSDMSMEVRNFVAGPAKAHWDGDDLVVEVDQPISGYAEWYRGPVTDSNEVFIKKQIKDIPEKPLPVVPPEEKVVLLLKQELYYLGYGDDYFRAIAERIVDVLNPTEGVKDEESTVGS